MEEQSSGDLLEVVPCVAVSGGVTQPQRQTKECALSAQAITVSNAVHDACASAVDQALRHTRWPLLHAWSQDVAATESIETSQEVLTAL